MKKLLIVLSLVLLCACSSAGNYSYPQNKDEVLFKGPNNVSYTKNELYKSLKLTSQSAITSNILKNIALSYDEINMEDLEKEAQDFVDEYIEMGYESYIISYYGSLENYKKSYIESLLIHELSHIYAENNFDSLVNENKPVKMQMASFSTVEEAQKCIDDFNNGSTFDMAAVNNNSLTTAESQVYSDTDTSIAFEVKQYLNETDTLGISSIITHSDVTTAADGSTSENNTYYVLNVESRNVEDFKEDFIHLMGEKTTTETLQNYFFEKHDIKFYDQDLYELMSSAFEVLK